jgi:hypothetical protein
MNLDRSAVNSNTLGLSILFRTENVHSVPFFLFSWAEIKYKEVKNYCTIDY